MIVCGPSGRIYAVLSDAPGKFNDASIFRNSALFKLLDEQKWRPFPGAVLLGDSAYMVCKTTKYLNIINLKFRAKTIKIKQMFKFSYHSV